MPNHSLDCYQLQPTQKIVMFFLTLLLVLVPTTLAKSPCQEAILRCCSPGQAATGATWRCFEQNNCAGLFTAHEEGTARTDLGACAFHADVLNSLDYDVDYDNDEEPSIGLRTAVPRRQQDSLDIEEEEEEVKEELAAKETDLRPKYFLQNGFFYHYMPHSFYHHHHYGQFQRYHSAVSYPFTYSYYY